jgi:hypothetical protein
MVILRPKHGIRMTFTQAAARELCLANMPAGGERLQS